jgi:hypothetical protein
LTSKLGQIGQSDSAVELVAPKRLQGLWFFSIAMGADNSFYVKFIATYAPTFFGYIISVLAIVNRLSYVYDLYFHLMIKENLPFLGPKWAPRQ